MSIIFYLFFFAIPIPLYVLDWIESSENTIIHLLESQVYVWFALLYPALPLPASPFSRRAFCKDAGISMHWNGGNMLFTPRLPWQLSACGVVKGVTDFFSCRAVDGAHTHSQMVCLRRAWPLSFHSFGPKANTVSDACVSFCVCVCLLCVSHFSWSVTEKRLNLNFSLSVSNEIGGGKRTTRNWCRAFSIIGLFP